MSYAYKLKWGSILKLIGNKSSSQALYTHSNPWILSMWDNPTFIFQHILIFIPTRNSWKYHIDVSYNMRWSSYYIKGMFNYLLHREPHNESMPSCLPWSHNQHKLYKRGSCTHDKPRTHLHSNRTPLAPHKSHTEAPQTASSLITLFNPQLGTPIALISSSFSLSAN